jgi:hypothetical protein
LGWDRGYLISDNWGSTLSWQKLFKSLASRASEPENVEAESESYTEISEDDFFEITMELSDCAYECGYWEVSYKLEETLDVFVQERARRSRGFHLFKSSRNGSIESRGTEGFQHLMRLAEERAIRPKSNPSENRRRMNKENRPNLAKEKARPTIERKTLKKNDCGAAVEIPSLTGTFFRKMGYFP